MAMDPEWHEGMINANIDIFEMSGLFQALENLENIRRTNGPNPPSLPVNN
jgi:hypothetical protein